MVLQYCKSGLTIELKSSGGMDSLMFARDHLRTARVWHAFEIAPDACLWKYRWQSAMIPRFFCSSVTYNGMPFKV